MNIVVAYWAVDGYRQRRSFRTLAGAQKFAKRWVGATPELGAAYAVSADGVGTIRVVHGCALKELFPALAPPPAGPDAFEELMGRSPDYELEYDPLPGEIEAC